MPRTHVPATSTHAIRNPGKAVQQVHCRPTASGAAKATAVLQKEEARLQRRAYEQEVESFNEHRNREIARITKKFEKMDRYVRGVLCHKSSVKTTRRKNLRNAIKYDRALKARAAGEQKSLEDYNNNLQDEIDDGAAFDEQSLGKVEYDRLMDQLEEKRQTKTRGGPLKRHNTSAQHLVLFCDFLGPHSGLWLGDIKENWSEPKRPVIAPDTSRVTH
ncbi:hypothetical protein B0H14DRAFT_3425684 [Mycena olivaceomarginata]|nr:hypothetical protein B0H14DRAFT_3425684 [Mycena olivaceomarginata]